MIEKIYTPAEVAEILRISPKTVRNKLRAGEFGDTVNINQRMHLITESGLQEYITKHTGQAYQPKITRQRATPEPLPGRKTGRI